jgi:hypothetical protein
VLAIAGITTWFGYLVMVYGLSQLDHQNYSFLDLAVPGKFTLGTPAPDGPSTGGGGEGIGGVSGNPTPCTKAQIAAGYTTGIDGNCNGPANPAPSGSKGPGVGYNTCINNKTGKATLVKGKCPAGTTASQIPGRTGMV